MRIISEPVEMIAWFTGDSWPRPLRFRRTRGEEEPARVVRVDRISQVTEEKKAGIRSLVYRCQSLVEGREVVYELQYLPEDCRWRLYKI